MKKVLNFLFFIISVQLFAQQGGMWIPSLLKGKNEQEMKKLGMKMSVSDIYDVNKSSLKDAVVHFDGGCTGEVISPQGLILTNHHCGYGEIQSHSSVEHNYLQDGFWAKNYEEELPNKNLEVTFIVKIEDVTTRVLQGTQTLNTEAKKQTKIAENIKNIESTFPKEDYQTNVVRSFFDGNQYLLFVTEVYKDVRLVGAPPSSIGKFGSDTDNWVWPRHTGDFALFRIYADKNNRPAEYSKDNVPYKPKHYFPISLNGVKEDDFTMVFGFPGRTQEYLPSYAIEQILNHINPARIEIRDNALKIADGYMRKDAQIKIQYASKYARIANYWKKWIGESKGLTQANAVAIKKDFEKDFQTKLQKAAKQSEYGTLLSDFEKLYSEITPYALSMEYFQEVAMRNVELLKVGFQLYRFAKSGNTDSKSKEKFLKNLEDTYKDYNAEVDRDTFEKLIELYATKAPEHLTPQIIKVQDYKKLTDEVYQNSALTSLQGIKQLFEKDNDLVDNLLQDKGYQIIKALADNLYLKVLPTYNQLSEKIDATQRLYMKAQLELYPNSRIFPDANGTLRVTYGKVKGYQPKDAVNYHHTTYLEGIIEKYIPGDYEFDVPEKLRTLYNDKDYGIYADENGKLPVNFIATNHTTGGNSGSPAIDANGNLIGLNFDRVWEGTMSDIHYDPSICRNIMVDTRYILFIIDKYAGATHLIKEMKIVKNKKNNVSKRYKSSK